MKKYTLFLPFLALVFALTSCSETELRSDMMEVSTCWNIDESTYIDRFENQLGTIRQVTLWVPGTMDETGQTRGEDATEYTVWVIMPDAYPHLMFEACNLPETQRIENRRVSFSGYTLDYHPEVTNFEGVTPFELIEITDGEAGPDADHDWDC